MHKFFLSLLSLIVFAPIQTVNAQSAPKYSYQSQQKLIPAELGAIYLGIDLKAFSQKIKLDKAEVDDSFEELRLDIPFEKGNIKRIIVKFIGLTPEQKQALVKTETITEKGEYGNIEREVKRLVTANITAAGKLYEVSFFYKEGYDLKKYVTEKYGKPSDVYKKGDDYHLYDMQWTKISADKLVWLIRYYEETNALMLAGRIPGSEWSVGD
jgi:hypothetical protein